MDIELDFDADALKRFIRVLNGTYNLYDVEKIPIELVDMLCKPVNDIVRMMKIPVVTKLVDDKEIIVKFRMPENFEVWLETNGEREA
jgi:hypothetical protein